VLFAIHLLLTGTILYTQWTERGNELVIEEVGLQFPLLLILSTLWSGLWVRQLAIPSFVVALLVSLVASNIYLRLKRSYPLTAESDWQEHVFVHLPFSLYHGWTVFILIVNGFTAFAPAYWRAGSVAKVFAIWLLALLCGVSVAYAATTKSGDIPGATVITLGLFAIFSHHNQPGTLHWLTLAFAIVSLLAVVKSVVGTWQVWRGGQIRLDEVGGQQLPT